MERSGAGPFEGLPTTIKPLALPEATYSPDSPILQRRHSLQQKLVARAQGLRAGGNGAVQVNERVVLVVPGPRGQAKAVGVAGFGEVGPISHHLLAQLAVFGADGLAGARVEGAEDVLDIVGVEGECAGVVLAGKRGQLKVIAVDRRLPRFAMRLDPLPCAEGNEVVTAVVDG